MNPDRGRIALALAILAVLGGCGAGSRVSSTASRQRTQGPLDAGLRRTFVPLAGSIPPLLDPHNVYAAERPGLLSPTVRGDPALVYVPNSQSNTVDVISQRTFRIVKQFPVGALPQHVTPSWDLRTLYVTNDAGNSLTPIDPRTATPGKPIPVLDPV